MNGTSRFTGPGPAGEHRCRSLPQRERQHVDARGLERALDDRAQHVREIRLVVLVDSWNGPRLNCEVGTLAVIAKNADESDSAVSSDMTRLAEPGPVEVSVATGRWRTR